MAILSQQHSSVVESHRPWLLRVIRSRVGDDLAEEVLQEVHIAALRATDSIPDWEIVPWLCGVAVRQCALAVRTETRQKQRVERYANSVAPNLCEPNDDPLLWLLSREARECVREAISTLPADSQQLLTWKYLDCLTYREIAARLEITPKNTAYRITEAKKQLRACLIERGLGGHDE